MARPAGMLARRFGSLLLFPRVVFVMHRYVATVLFGLMISASHALYDQAGRPSAKLPIVLLLLLGGVVFVFGRSTRLNASYVALSLSLFVCALLSSGGRLALWPAGALDVEQFGPALTWVPWIVVACGIVLACQTLGAALVRRSQRADAVRQAQFAAPTRLDVRPGSQRMLRPEDRRIITRQRALDDAGGGL